MEFTNFDLWLSLSDDSSVLTAEWVGGDLTPASVSTELGRIRWDNDKTKDSNRFVPLATAVKFVLDAGGAPSPRRDLARRLGSAMLPEPIRRALVDRLRDATTRGQGIRLRIACSANAESFPWEMATARLDDFDGPVAVHRHISVTRWVRDAATHDAGVFDLRITMVDSLWGYVDQHGWPALAAEFAELSDEILEAEPVFKPTLGDLYSIASTILHFRGHGSGERYEGVSESAVTLWNDDGKPAEWSAAEFAGALLTAGLRAKLVVLQACSTADSNTRHGFGIDLLRRGVRAVIASVADLHNDQATVFFSKFYAELLRVGDLEIALMYTRRSAADDSFLQEEWWAHALYCNHPPSTRFVARVERLGLAASTERPYTWVHYALNDPHNRKSRHVRLEVPAQSKGAATWPIVEREASSVGSGLTGTEQRRDSMVVRACPSGRVIGHLADGALHLFAVNQTPILNYDDDKRATWLRSVDLAAADGLPTRLLALRSCSRAGSSIITALLYGSGQLSALAVDLASGECSPQAVATGRFRAGALGRAFVAAITDERQLWLAGEGPIHEILRSMQPQLAEAELIDIDVCEAPLGGASSVALLAERTLWCVSEQQGVLHHDLTRAATAVQFVRPGRRPKSLTPAVVWPIDTLVWFQDGPPQPLPALANAGSGF